MVERVSFDPSHEGAGMNLADLAGDRLPQWAGPWFGLGACLKGRTTATESSRSVAAGVAVHDGEGAAMPSPGGLAVTGTTTGHDGTVAATPERLRSVAEAASLSVQNAAQADIDSALREAIDHLRRSPAASAPGGTSPSATAPSATADGPVGSSRAARVALDELETHLTAIGAEQRTRLEQVVRLANTQLDRTASLGGPAVDGAVAGQTVTDATDADDTADPVVLARALGERLARSRPTGPLAVVVAPDGRGVSLADSVGSPVADVGGLAGGHLRVLNATLPSLAGAVHAVGDIVTAVGTTDQPNGASATDLVGAVLTRLAAQSSRVAPGGAPAAYLGTQRAGLDDTGSTLSLALGAPTAAQDARSRDAEVLRPVAAAAGVLAATVQRSVQAVEAPEPALASASSHPDIATATAGAQTPAVSVSLRVLSVASGPVVAGEPVDPGQVLGDGGRVSLGIELTRRTPDGGTQPVASATVHAGPAAQLADVAHAVNLSGLPVTATVVTTSAGSAQLQVRSLVTGRTSQITVTDGGVPPSAATVLGRFTRMESGTDSIALVDRPSGMPTVAFSSTTEIPEVEPGVAVRVTSAAPEVTVRLAAGGAAERAADAVVSAVAAVGALERSAEHALSAGVTEEAAQDVNRLVALVRRAIGGLPGARSVPGERGGEDSLTLERRDVVAAFRSDPAGARERTLTALRGTGTAAEEAAAQRAGYLAVRLYTDPAGELTDYASSARREASSGERVENGSELSALLARLNAQGGWLRSSRQ